MGNLSRRTIGLLAGAAVILVAVGVVIGVLLNGDDPAAGQEATRTSPPPSLTPLEQACLDAGERLTVQVYFVASGSDDHMRRAAEALRDDDRIAELTTETQAEAYARFKVIFKDQPDLVELARPESLPASVVAVPADDVSRAELAAALEDELTGVDEVKSDGCGSGPSPAPPPSR